jgi:hypothetical protein
MTCLSPVDEVERMEQRIAAHLLAVGILLQKPLINQVVLFMENPSLGAIKNPL